MTMTRRAMMVAAAGFAASVPLAGAAQGGPVIHVLKDPNCGCCTAWIEILKEEGFTVTLPTFSAKERFQESTLTVSGREEVEGRDGARVSAWVVEQRGGGGAAGRFPQTHYVDPQTRAILKTEIAAPGMMIVAVPMTEADLAARDRAVADAEAAEQAVQVGACEYINIKPGRVGGLLNAFTNFFVRGGESDYNKVLIDGVPVNLPGDTYDFAHIPLDNVDWIEVVRGPQSALFGSDAMSSVVQVFTRSGPASPVVDYTLEGGSFGTLRQAASARGSFRGLDFSNTFSFVIGDDTKGFQGECIFRRRTNGNAHAASC